MRKMALVLVLMSVLLAAVLALRDGGTRSQAISFQTESRQVAIRDEDFAGSQR